MSFWRLNYFRPLQRGLADRVWTLLSHTFELSDFGCILAYFSSKLIDRFFAFNHLES